MQEGIREAYCLLHVADGHLPQCMHLPLSDLTQQVFTVDTALNDTVSLVVLDGVVAPMKSASTTADWDSFMVEQEFLRGCDLNVTCQATWAPDGIVATWLKVGVRQCGVVLGVG